jgi:phospholipid N-methyltransferase
MMKATEGYLGAAEVRDLAELLGLTPTKRLGQNFVVDANTVRRIVQTAGVTDADTVLEVGPGLGSLTLGLLAAGASVLAVEIDARLAEQLPVTVEQLRPGAKLTVLTADALTVTELPAEPNALVANLPYNVSVPVILHLLEHVPSLRTGLVMVQAEVGQRIAAPPGSRVYGAPSVKAAWYGAWRTAEPARHGGGAPVDVRDRGCRVRPAQEDAAPGARGGVRRPRIRGSRQCRSGPDGARRAALGRGLPGGRAQRLSPRTSTRLGQ